jgi:protein disulfide-isomerase A6
LDAAKQVANDRLSGKGGKSGSGSSNKSSGNSGSKSDDGKTEVVELTDSNFESLVLKSNDFWMVEFFAPWYALRTFVCGHY